MGSMVAKAGQLKSEELSEFFERLRQQVDFPPQIAGPYPDETDYWEVKILEISSVLGASSKEDIKSHLQRFLWVENICERYSEEIWKGLENVQFGSAFRKLQHSVL